MSDSGCSRDAGAARNIAKQHRALRPLSAPPRFSYPTILPSFRLLRRPLLPSNLSRPSPTRFVYSLTHSLSLFPRPADPLCAFFLACALGSSECHGFLAESLIPVQFPSEIVNASYPIATRHPLYLNAAAAHCCRRGRFISTILRRFFWFRDNSDSARFHLCDTGRCDGV